MASSIRKKRFREPQSVDQTVENVKKSTPRSTMYKNRWAVRIFEEWRFGRRNKQANREDNPFNLNLETVENLDKPLWRMSLASMNFWLIKFVQELTDKDGDSYPEKTIYQIVCGIRRYLEGHGRAEANILDGKNYSFQVFRKVLDAEMKKSHRNGEHMTTKRIRKEKKPITEDEERTLWSKDLLGNENAQCLLHTIYYYVGKLFGVRPCEHRQLRVSNFVVEDNKITYRENVSKTYHGGLKDLKKKARLVTHYCHTENDIEHKPCLVRMFKQYIDLVCGLERIEDAFYFRPSKTHYKYENAPVGIHKLNSIVPSLMSDAGLEAKTAHCLRVTTATSLFQGQHEEKLIRERTGHVSSALFRYEKANKEQQIAVSTSVGPCVTSEDKPETDDEKEDEIFNVSDKELDTLLSQCDWSEFDNHEQRNIAGEHMMLSSNTFNNCSVSITINKK